MNDGYSDYRVIGIRPNWPADPDAYESFFGDFEEAIEDGKNARDGMQSWLEDHDGVCGVICAELPYTIVQGYYYITDIEDLSCILIEDEAFGEWDDLEYFHCHCPNKSNE